MKKTCYIIFFLLSGLVISAIPDVKFPEAEITNGIIHARLYLPDPRHGYYRGSRFDWSGVMPELVYKGHNWCGQWFEKYSPTLHDAIMGPVESFSPLGYEEAQPGGSFIGIGIGVLSKPDTLRYSPFKYYTVLNPGKWKVKRKPGENEIVFRHILNDGAWSYEYEKTIRLEKGKPEMVLEHVLRNTGRRTIETNVYDHNFFLPDHQPTGPGFVIGFPFKLSAEESRGIGDMAAIRDSQIVFLRKLVNREQVYSVLKGFGNNAKDYDIRLENHTTGTGVRITCDRPLSKLVFWSCPTTACPEPYIQMKINPGEVFKWKIAYEFYTCDISRRETDDPHSGVHP